MFCVMFCDGDMADRAARAVDLGGAQRLVEVGLVLDVALDGLEADGQQLRRIVALHGIDVGVAAGLVLEGLAEGGVLGIVEAVAVVQRRLDALGGGALRPRACPR